MKKGDIWIVELPLTGGHEQAGMRPAIVLADTPSSVAIVVPCTSNLKALQLPHTFSIDPSEKNGLENTSVALVLQIRALDKRRLQKRIGTLEPSLMEEINKTLRELLVI